MANKNFFQPVRMESQFVDTKLQTVMFQAESENAAVLDGTLAVLGDFTTDPVYKTAFTNAGQAAQAPVDVNCRVASAPDAATAAGVGVIDIAGVATAVGGGNTYRIGYKTIGLQAEAGVPVRFRKFVVDDVFMTGEENCAGALTVGQYAIVEASTGKWKANASATANLCAKVIAKTTISQGVDGNVTTGNGVTAYTLCVVSV